jgi:hypothetical protein
VIKPECESGAIGNRENRLQIVQRAKSYELTGGVRCACWNWRARQDNRGPIAPGRIGLIAGQPLPSLGDNSGLEPVSPVTPPLDARTQMRARHKLRLGYL